MALKGQKIRVRRCYWHGRCLQRRSCFCPMSSPCNIACLFRFKRCKIQNLTSKDAKLYHIVIHSSLNVTVERGRIEAPGDSPNTDGIHVQNSNLVCVDGTTIMTGDDCISIGPATRDLHIMGVNCGPRHGISIGSLGKDTIKGVEGVVVMTRIFCSITFSTQSLNVDDFFSTSS